MIPQIPGLFAQVSETTYYAFSRPQMMTEWWQWMLFLSVCLAIGAFVIFLYIIDSRELPRGVAITLTSLRLFAFVGLFFFFMQLEQRTTQTLVNNSRMHMLIDTSLSMGMRDQEEGGDPSEESSRIDRVIQSLKEGDLLPDLQQKHDVICYRFDEQGQPTEVASFPKINSTSMVMQSKPTAAMLEQQLSEKRRLLLFAGLLILLSLPAILAYAAKARKPNPGAFRSWVLLAGVGCLAVAIILIGMASLRNHQIPLAAALGISEISPESVASSRSETLFPTRGDEFRLLKTIFQISTLLAIATLLPFIILKLQKTTGDFLSWILILLIVSVGVSVITSSITRIRFNDVRENSGLLSLAGFKEPPNWRDEDKPDAPADAQPNSDEEDTPEESILDWPTEFALRGQSTRIGDAVDAIIQKERGGPIAGIVVISDGCSNAGLEPESIVEGAQDAQIPIYTVGMGSTDRPVNVRIIELEAPPRAHNEDSFTVTGYLQGTNLMGSRVEVQLYSSPESEQGESLGQFEQADSVILGGDGEDVTVTFEIDPSELGRQVYTLQVTPPSQDHDPTDNAQSATVEIVDRRTRILLFAGGPTREYRFLRNLLFRDREMTVDVCIQSAPPNISQDADAILTEFPRISDDLFEYDCIVAFDPNWSALDASQVRILERWIAEKGGGLIAIAGPVHTPQWSERRPGDEVIDTIKDIYPVVFSRMSANLVIERFGSTVPLPVEFTAEGISAEFLWLDDDSLESQGRWAQFEGVYGYCATRDIKSGAHLYSYIRRESNGGSESGEQQIYMASQFYGSGRVFYLASGEMWRVRAISDACFEQFYTKLVRFAAEGRMLRDSSRGVLLVDKARCLLRETVAVRAQLTDLLHEPLTDEKVMATLIAPNRSSSTDLELRRLDDTGREGMYIGEFTPLLPGKYHIELPVPNSSDEMLSRNVIVRIPKLEQEDPSRKDSLLIELARNTEGKYYVGMEAASGAGGSPGLAIDILPRSQSNDITGTPDPDFHRRQMTWLLVLIAGALGLEWLIRRLSKLA